MTAARDRLHQVRLSIYRREQTIAGLEAQLGRAGATEAESLRRTLAHERDRLALLIEERARLITAAGDGAGDPGGP